MPPKVKYLFFHTAAADIRNVDAAVIDRWHRERGWKRVGYHYVIIDDRHDTKRDGEVELGRPEDEIGAHVLHLNSESLGICCVGHGDRRNYTMAQKHSLIRLLADLSRRYKVPTENILGHREVNRLVEDGRVGKDARTTKTCPGKRVDCDGIRRLVEAELAAPAMAMVAAPGALDAIKDAISVLHRHETLLGNAREEWRRFAFHGEIRAIVEGDQPAPAPV